MKFELEKYLEISSIHGLQYLSKKYHIVKRIFWIISLIGSLAVTVLLVYKLIHKIQTVPVITFQSEESTPISEVQYINS